MADDSQGEEDLDASQGEEELGRKAYDAGCKANGLNGCFWVRTSVNCLARVGNCATTLYAAGVDFHWL